MTRRRITHGMLVGCSLAAIVAGCDTMHRPRGGHFVTHGFYQAAGRYRVRALSQTPETTLVSDEWALVGFGAAKGGVPGLEEPDARYDFRYQHPRLGRIWARTVPGPRGPPFPGPAPMWCALANVPMPLDAAAYRFVSHGPAEVDAEPAWIVTFDIWRPIGNGAAESRVTMAAVRPGYDPLTDGRRRRRRSPPLVLFTYVSSIDAHGEGIADFESMLARVDFR
jgi:hypothetical protein